MKETFLYKLLDYLWQNWKWRKVCHVCFGAHVSHGTMFEGENFLGKGTNFRGTLGYGSYIGGDCHLRADVGKFTSIAPNVQSVVGCHPYKEPFATTSPMFYQKDIRNMHSFAKEDTFRSVTYYDEKRRIDVKIGNDCWLGSEIIIVGGVTIGDGAVVLARAVVTKDVPPYAIVAGVPARIKGYRFNAATIEWLLERQWWNEDEKWLRKNWRKLNDIEELRNID